jgi:hypothetical protein
LGDQVMGNAAADETIGTGKENLHGKKPVAGERATTIGVNN